ncbi:MAG: winged helix-turn-helix domain-containing protein [Acidimicrobiia bacterium]|nr:winged helix-turn-helix domain-containing protein [Acidimicrobiia bacterium]
MALTFAGCELDLGRQLLTRDGETVGIEPQALRILVQLIDSRDRVVTKNELLDAVWGDRFVSESALTTQIKALRKALGDTGRDQQIVKTVHGRGYMFVAPVEEDDGSDGSSEPERANPVIAVLPFKNLSPNPAQSHVSEGITHDIVTALSKHRWLKVLTRAVTDRYAEDRDAFSRLRDELGVDYVVDGSVRRAGDRLRVTVSLTDAAEGAGTWAERYDRQVEDLFAVQDEITEVIVANIEPEVGYAERQRVSRRTRSNLRAWDLYHLGVAHFFRFTAEDNREAQRLLAESRELDSSFGDAHAWWAYATILGMVYWDTEADSESLDAALSATQQALELDQHNAVYHALRGRVQLARREYNSALLENERAIELNPTFAAAYCGLGDSLCYEGRYDEAIAQFERAVTMGTHDPQRWAFLSYGALALLFAERFDEAIEWAERASTIPNCQYWTTAHRVVGLAKLGRAADAEAAAAGLLAECPGFSIQYARDKLFYLKRPEQLDLYIGGLRLAGVPER